MKRFLVITLVMILASIIARKGQNNGLQVHVNGKSRFIQILLLVATLVLLVATIAMLAVVIMQTNTLNKQTTILQADFEARNRPYLAIDDIQMGLVSGGSSNVTLNVRNYGVVPATDVKLRQMNVYHGVYIPTPKSCIETEQGVTLCGQGILTHATVSVKPSSNRIFYPGRLGQINFTMDEQTHTDIGAFGGFTIILQYSSGEDDYAYKADVVIKDPQKNLYTKPLKQKFLKLKIVYL